VNTRISVIVPAHNEERRLAPTIERVAAWAVTLTPPAEILIVESGSTDATTAVAEGLAVRYSSVRVIHAPLGKGNAIAAGVNAASGDVLYMCDADLSTPIEDAWRLLEPVIKGECDLAIGSREGATARRVGEPGYRRVMGRVFNWTVQLIAVPGIKDTQCGFKCFHAARIRPVFQQMTIGGFAFDVELLFLARRAGLRIREIPVRWTFDADSRVRAVRDSVAMLASIAGIRIRSLRGGYRSPA
jgi:glycosyltransferase involved in cell wall biosynthesis